MRPHSDVITISLDNCLFNSRFDVGLWSPISTVIMVGYLGMSKSFVKVMCAFSEECDIDSWDDVSKVLA